MQTAKRVFIAELLQQQGYINAEQIANALDEQKHSDKKIGQILVEKGFVTKQTLMDTLALQLGIPYVDLTEFNVDPKTARILPEVYVRNLRVLLLRKTPEGFLLGMVDPQDMLAKEEVEKLLSAPIKVALIDEDGYLSNVAAIFRRTEEISKFAESLAADLKTSENQSLLSEDNLAAQDLPVVHLLRSIFADALQTNASDIHIEPGSDHLRIRYRIDGILQEQIVDKKDITDALVQRVKLTAGMNIAEKRLPQDGRFTINIKDTVFDVRVSTLPVHYGESLVMRLLNQSSPLLHLHELHMPALVLQTLQSLLKSSYGLFLVLGPTGSGKTTTLYSALNEMDQVENKIITVEDPVEYQFSAINQVNVNPKIDLTFANVLRTILRQDPDIIMVGELRDYETLEIALRAAMTGHFVLSTLHTHDTINSVMRMLDMGAPSYLMASVLRGLLAQRLVRKICERCIAAYEPVAGEVSWLKNLNIEITSIEFKRGKGCSHCHFTGYRGRLGVYELLIINEDIAEAIRTNDLNNLTHLAQQQATYRSLVKSGIDLVIEGKTTVSEIISMAGEIC